MIEYFQKWQQYLCQQYLLKIAVTNCKITRNQLITCKAFPEAENKHPKNLIFVGVYNIAPVNWAIPSIFEEIGKGGVF